MARIETRVTEKELELWQKICEKEGKSGAELLRNFVRKSIEEVYYYTEEIRVEKPLKNKKATISFTEKERAKIAERAVEEGYDTPTRWMRSIVLRTLHQEAVLTEKEMDVLWQANRDLNSVGRNLNQIARAINTDFRESDKLKLELIAKLKEHIFDCTKKMNSLVVKNMSRWEDYRK